MPVAIIVMFACLQSFMTAGRDQRRLEKRTEVLSRAQIGLDGLIRDARQAEWIFFTSTQVVDFETRVRVAGGNTVERHVRYDCRTEACVRYEGAPVTFPPSGASSFYRSTEVIGANQTQEQHGRLVEHDVFVPQRVDPTTGERKTNYLDANLLIVKVRLQIAGLKSPIELSDGVSLRNTTRFAG